MRIKQVHEDKLRVHKEIHTDINIELLEKTSD